MTKQKLIIELSKKTGVERVVVTEILEATISIIKNTMMKGENCYLRGFGSFVVKKRKGKIGRNIIAGVPVIVPERYVPTWKPSKGFLDKVKANNKKRLTDDKKEK
jgi:DNA-binding protein HU-beta